MREVERRGDRGRPGKGAFSRAGHERRERGGRKEKGCIMQGAEKLIKGGVSGHALVHNSKPPEFITDTLVKMNIFLHMGLF